MSVEFLSGMIDDVTAKRRHRLRLIGERPGQRASAGTLIAIAERLLSVLGEASGTAPASLLQEEYADANENERPSFLEALTEQFGPDQRQLTLAIGSNQHDPGSHTIQELRADAEPRRQDLIRRIDQAPGRRVAWSECAKTYSMDWLRNNFCRPSMLISCTFLFTGHDALRPRPSACECREDAVKGTEPGSSE